MAEPSPPEVLAFAARVTPFQQNCTVVACPTTRKAAIIDPGANGVEILAEITRRGMTLEKIWITHGHLDHAGGAAALREATGVPIEGPHRDDQFWIERIEADRPRFGVPDARSFVPDRWLEDGDVVTLGDTQFEVYHCPGHTPGHVIFFHRESRFAQVGDVLFQGNVGRWDFPRGDFDSLVNSITQKLWPLGDDVRFMPGHGSMSTFGEERRSNPVVADHVLAQTRT
jgi:hydroxyacylglutathione hydrolase